MKNLNLGATENTPISIGISIGDQPRLDLLAIAHHSIRAALDYRTNYKAGSRRN
jgi:hypothetical protein